MKIYFYSALVGVVIVVLSFCMTILSGGDWPTAFAATFESNAQSPTNDTWTLWNYSAGQTFTAASTHTVTSIQVQLSFNSGMVKLHLTNTSGDLPTSDLAVSDTVYVSGTSYYTFTVSCTSLTSGTVYGFWLESVSGTPGGLIGTDPGAYGGGQLTYRYPSSIAIPNTGTSEDANFTIFGDSGACYTPPPPPPSTGAAGSLNVYGFLVITVGIYLIGLVAFLVLFYIMAVIVGWPIKYFVRSIYNIIRHSGRGLYD